MNQENIRNFAIIAHIDHGKSTLADRLLELTNTIPARKMREQALDTMDLERERGITIKLQPVRMIYKIPNSKSQVPNNNQFQNSNDQKGLKIGNWKLENSDSKCILNLIDTPGHVDFSYEVSRSLAAVEGAILLVDATQGIQAQTLANLKIAQNHDLKIIPVINKIDVPAAEPDRIVEDLSKLLKIDKQEIIQISARTGENVEKVIQKIIQDIPAPTGAKDQPLSALVFDSSYDPYRGVIAYVRIFDGQAKAEQGIELVNAKLKSKSLEIGYFSPTLEKYEILSAGEIGYIITGLKDLTKCRVGETITLSPIPQNFQPLKGYAEPQSNVYASIFPIDNDQFPVLSEALAKLKLNDASLFFERDSSPALGSGFRCGFLGLLHMEIVAERLRREYDLEVVLTPPSVEYKIAKTNGENKIINNPALLPDQSEIRSISEPWVNVEIISPKKYLGEVMALLPNLRGELIDNGFIDQKTVILHYKMPFANLISGLYNSLKSATSGYGSFSYQKLGFEPSDLVKLDIIIAGEKSGAFAQIVHRSQAQNKGRSFVKKLKELIPKQMFQVSLQAAIGSKVIAREDISALKKDVIAKLYGGDRTRKDKLLKKQAKGKARMKKLGRIDIPSDVFLKILKT
jgi:GTP-binding protein LepA